MVPRLYFVLVEVELVIHFPIIHVPSFLLLLNSLACLMSDFRWSNWASSETFPFCFGLRSRSDWSFLWGQFHILQGYGTIPYLYGVQYLPCAVLSEMVGTRALSHVTLTFMAICSASDLVDSWGCSILMARYRCSIALTKGSRVDGIVSTWSRGGPMTVSQSSALDPVCFKVQPGCLSESELSTLHLEWLGIVLDYVRSKSQIYIWEYNWLNIFANPTCLLTHNLVICLFSALAKRLNFILYSPKLGNYLS